MSSFFTDGVVVIKSGKLLFNHPQETNDDRFWAVALAIYTATKVAAPSPPLIGSN